MGSRTLSCYFTLKPVLLEDSTIYLFTFGQGGCTGLIHYDVLLNVPQWMVPRWSIIHSIVSLVRLLTLDTGTQTLYWTDNKQHQLESSSVNGSNRRIVIRSIQSPLSDPTYGLDIFQDAIYWTNSVTKQLYSIRLDRIFIRSIRRFPATDGLYEIAIVAPSKQPLGKYCHS